MLRLDAVGATASKMRRCWLPASALDESQKVGVELLLVGDRQSVGCAGAAIDFVAGREVQYSRAHLFGRASQPGGAATGGPFRPLRKEAERRKCCRAGAVLVWNNRETEMANLVEIKALFLALVGGSPGG
jgi:hypothetical protein